MDITTDPHHRDRPTYTSEDDDPSDESTWPTYYPTYTPASYSSASSSEPYDCGGDASITSIGATTDPLGASATASSASTSSFSLTDILPTTFPAITPPSGIPSTSDSAASTPPTSGNGSTNLDSRPSPGIIAGATIGSLAGLTFLVAGVFLIVRRRKKSEWEASPSARATQRRSFYGLPPRQADGSATTFASDGSILNAGRAADGWNGPVMTESGYIHGEPPTESSEELYGNSSMGGMHVASSDSHGQTFTEHSFVPPIRRQSRGAQSVIGLAASSGTPHAVPSPEPESPATRLASTSDPYARRWSTLSVRNPDVNPTHSQRSSTPSNPDADGRLAFMSTIHSATDSNWSSRDSRGSAGSDPYALGYPRLRGGEEQSSFVRDTPYSVNDVSFGGGETGGADYFRRPTGS